MYIVIDNFTYRIINNVNKDNGVYTYTKQHYDTVLAMRNLELAPFISI